MRKRNTIKESKWRKIRRKGERVRRKCKYKCKEEEKSERFHRKWFVNIVNRKLNFLSPSSFQF